MNKVRLLAPLLAIAWSLPAMATEEPAYSVVESDGAFEIRDYAAITIAETVVNERFDEAGNAAFRPLFRYISGGNREEQKLDMTAPVLQQAETGGGFRVGFITPAGYSLKSAPRPDNPDILLREIPAQRMAVLRYSGRWTEKSYREHERKLLARIEAQGLAAAGPVYYARYDAPFVPWFMRRNEVMVAVRAP